MLTPVPAAAGATAAAAAAAAAAVDAFKGPEFMNEHVCIDFGEGDENGGG
eukprot:evm.model.NODE_50782_length_17496_cov_38.867569.1